MLYEFCAENLTNVEAALKAGARRIELCDNLAVGGTTPSAGVIEQAVALIHKHEGATVRAIIRPRGGDFVYSKAEFKAMETDIRYAGANGVDGVVIGCLKRNGSGDGFELGPRGDGSASSRLSKVWARCAGGSSASRSTWPSTHWTPRPSLTPSMSLRSLASTASSRTARGGNAH